MKIITLKSSGLGRYDDVSPFIIAEGKLELKVDLPTFNGEFVFVAENNGIKFKKQISNNGKVSFEGLTAGELHGEIKHYLKANLIKTYTVEPLILREVDGSLSGTPEIAALRRNTDTLVKSLNELKQALERREKTIAALIRFAFKDYNDNVYLKGGSMDEFLKEFRFELTNDEVKNIFGGDNND